MIEKFRKLLPAVLMVAMAAAAVPAWGQAGAPMVVGRVSHVEGDLLRWVPAGQRLGGRSQGRPFRSRRRPLFRGRRQVGAYRP